MRKNNPLRITCLSEGCVQKCVVKSNSMFIIIYTVSLKNQNLITLPLVKITKTISMQFGSIREDTMEDLVR